METEIQIYNKANGDAFKTWLKEKKLQLDIYYQPEFLQVEATLHHTEYELFIVSNKTSVFIYPYLKLALTGSFKGYTDVFSPYGYAGPYASDKHIMEEGEQLLINHFRSINVVSEFIRYHFLYNKELKFSSDISNLQNRKVLCLNLQQSWQFIWEKEFSTTNRNLSTKLHKEGYRFEIVEFSGHIDGFTEMYYSTMKNVNANDYYYFPKDFFIGLKNKLGDNLILARVVKDSVCYCYSLFFISGNIITYFLSARNIDFPKVPANNLLLSEIAKWSAEKGFSYLNLGGGLKNSTDDTLFKFKSNFTKSVYDYFIGKRIYKPEVYREITDEWIKLHGEKEFEKVKNILHFYHSSQG
ncbi:MAG: hypothetical protein ACXVPU_17300 [Bacteroidia bacterium]